MCSANMASSVSLQHGPVVTSLDPGRSTSSIFSGRNPMALVLQLFQAPEKKHFTTCPRFLVEPRGLKDREILRSHFD